MGIAVLYISSHCAVCKCMYLQWSAFHHQKVCGMWYGMHNLQQACQRNCWNINCWTAPGVNFHEASAASAQLLQRCGNHRVGNAGEHNTAGNLVCVLWYKTEKHTWKNKTTFFQDHLDFLFESMSTQLKAEIFLVSLEKKMDGNVTITNYMDALMGSGARKGHE